MTKTLVLLLLFYFICLGNFTMMGGRETVSNPNQSDLIRRISRFATEQINAKSNSLYAMRCTNIISAATQVVAGINYFLTIELSPTVCKLNTGKLSNLNVQKCKLLTGPRAAAMDLTCTVQVYERAWEHLIKLVDFNCHPTYRGST
ncbi:U7-hexatoxin-Hi1a-like [Antedon mediterranea]|uniref:U7-hexatoxin-Hi1a-like n=1 Tax=Antedon mediterranea TaxID=105859 RepID=UPI003AF922EB